MMAQICKPKVVGSGRPATPRAAARRRSRLDGALDVELFRALGDETRLGLLSCLAKCGRACTVSVIGECCSVDLSVVSRHMAMLERAGVVEVEREGRRVSYAVRFRDLNRRFGELVEALKECEVRCEAGSEGGCGCE